MSFNVYEIDLSSFTISVKDLLKVKQKNGYIEYVPIYYLNLLQEKIKYLSEKVYQDNNLKSSIDFTADPLEDFFPS